MALADWMAQLSKPIEAGLSKGDLAREYNQMRGQIQGGTKAMAEEMKGSMLGRGFRSGESGIADSAIGRIYEQGGTNLAAAGTNVYLDEAKRRQDLAGMNLQRMLGAGGLELQNLASKRTTGLGSDQLAWDKDRFGQQLGFEKEQAAFGQEQTMMDQYMNFLRMMQGSQEEEYGAYRGAKGAAATGY